MQIIHEDSDTTTGYPVKGFDMVFKWQKIWEKLFDEQVKLLKDDVARRRNGENRSIIYLSCPISNRGGGFYETNVDIARFTQRRLIKKFGPRVWILNPAQYQLESKQGTGLFQRHARNLGLKIDVEELMEKHPLSGGDYMRMWTKVLVEDDGPNTGQNFDAYYFIGPSDARKFFTESGHGNVTAGVEAYFASKYATDLDFRSHYDTSDKNWRQLRDDFCRFYTLRASANFSKGCHDEWNIFQQLNQARLDVKRPDVGGMLAGYFDGAQIDPGAAITPILPGYAIQV